MSEEMLIRHCSPTLAGIKTGNIFNCTYNNIDDLLIEIRKLNRRLSKKGLRILPLRILDSTALIYVFRPIKLKKDLLHSDAYSLLSNHGYEAKNPSKCVTLLRARLKDNTEGFPHEIGLFLGYPPEDVRGFIENNAKDSKTVGCWKVYGDEEAAKKTFSRYKKCTKLYMKQYTRGRKIDKLTVAV